MRIRPILVLILLAGAAGTPPWNRVAAARGLHTGLCTRRGSPGGLDAREPAA